MRVKAELCVCYWMVCLLGFSSLIPLTTGSMECNVNESEVYPEIVMVVDQNELEN